MVSKMIYYHKKSEDKPVHLYPENSRTGKIDIVFEDDDDAEAALTDTLGGLLKKQKKKKKKKKKNRGTYSSGMYACVKYMCVLEAMSVSVRVNYLVLICHSNFTPPLQRMTSVAARCMKARERTRT
jgi:hypothetical protein